MKKIILFVFMILIFGGCVNKEPEKIEADEYDKELFQCLEKQLASYLKDDLEDIFEPQEEKK